MLAMKTMKISRSTKKKPKEAPIPELSTAIELAVFDSRQLRETLLNNFLEVSKTTMEDKERDIMLRDFQTFRDTLAEKVEEISKRAGYQSESSRQYMHESSCCGVSEVTGIASTNRDSLIKKIVSIFCQEDYNELNSGYFKYFNNVSDKTAIDTCAMLQSLGWKTTGFFWNWNMSHWNIELSADYGGKGEDEESWLMDDDYDDEF